MRRRILVANLLMLLAALLALLGGTALVFAAGPQGWSDLADATLFLVRGRAQLLAVLFVAALLLAVPLALLALRSAAVARRGEPVEPAGEVGRREPHGARLVGRARRRLDLEICRPSPDVDRVVDALLGAPLDLGVRALWLQPGEMLVEVAIEAAEQRHAVTSLPSSLYERVLGRLREMAGVAETGEGVVELRSSTQLQPLAVRLTRGAHGIETVVQVAGPDEGPARRRRPSSVVFRIERPPPIADVATLDLPAPIFDEHEATDPGSGLLTGLDRSGAHEVAALVGVRRPRVIGVAESWLRLVMGGLLIALALAGLWDAYGWGLARAGGRLRAPWRDVAIQVVSSPVTGEVSISGVVRGRTPLTVSEPCRGRATLVLVRARGYTTWQWSGLCPRSGRLELAADLQSQQ